MYYRVRDLSCDTRQWFNDNFRPLSSDVVETIISAGPNYYAMEYTYDNPKGYRTACFRPMWKTCWLGSDDDFSPEGRDAAIEAGFTVYDVPDLRDRNESGTVLAVMGAGYSFMREHIIPLRLAAATMNVVRNMTMLKVDGPLDDDIQDLKDLKGLLNEELQQTHDASQGLEEFMLSKLGRAV